MRLAGLLGILLLLAPAANPAPAAAAPLTYRLAVVVVNVGTIASDEERAALAQVAFGRWNSAASRFAQIGIKVTGQLVGPISLPAWRANSCDPGKYAWASGKELAARGIDVSAYRFVMYRVYRPAGSCAFNDSAYLGTRIGVLISTSADALAHEMGHNLGFVHANGLDCTGGGDERAVPGSATGCASEEYADHYSVMGASVTLNDVEQGDLVPFDAWRAYRFVPWVIGAPAKIPAPGRSFKLAFMSDRSGRGFHWGTLALANGWLLELELVQGRSVEWCTTYPSSTTGDAPRTSWTDASCGPTVVLRLLPPGGPLGIRASSYLIRALGLGATYRDARRSWSVSFAGFRDGIATVAIGS